MIDPDISFRAVRSRDARFDGRVFVAVITTGIYCRPICPAPPARRENMRFFEFAAAAERAGFRPCLRCRPEVAPSAPAWNGTSATVSRALRLIDEGALDSSRLDALARRLGVGARQLRRLFLEHVGAPPIAVAQARRVHFARQLIEQTSLPIAAIASAVGFRSLRRFNAAMKSTYRIAPREMRRRPAPSIAGGDITIRLAYRPPYDWDSLLAFLAARAIPGVETVVNSEYRRTIEIGGTAGVMRVRPSKQNELSLSLPNRFTRSLALTVDRVRRMFDLSADPRFIVRQFGKDPLLAPLLRRWPGIRVPGAWDGFEVAMRAVVGQQISVAGARTILGRIAARYGTRIETDDPELHVVFPPASRLARARIEHMPASRAATIREIALRFETTERSAEALTALRGVGPWTANYIAMRAFADPDAFPAGDLGLRKAAGGMTERELEKRAEAWRPWRAYAAMLLWRSL
jgi:AraC family transcriptional regulator of adaptative response / DNA-3-methyladenine glycosylase II